VSARYRPNVVLKLDGKKDETIWVVVHTDVVPAGNIDLWRTDPFKPVIKNNKIFGRGTEDNGQEIVAALYAAKCITDLNINLKRNVGIALVADEEVGSKHGIQFLIRKNIFKKQDLIIVPDHGTPESNKIEIAEKSILWLKFTVKGKQVHASTPHKGLNAFKISNMLLSALIKELPQKYNKKDILFEPPYSTFEPTKKEANVPNVNTVPGMDVFYMDCRVVPAYKLNSVMNTISDIAYRISQKTGAKIEFACVNRSDAPPPTSKNARVVVELRNAISKALNTKSKLIGIGGGTCASLFRQNGFSAAVWCTSNESAHQANEYADIDNMIKDAQVYAVLFAQADKI
jgi:succinyl-diaminopimelate desuccinylase